MKLSMVVFLGRRTLKREKGMQKARGEPPCAGLLVSPRLSRGQDEPQRVLWEESRHAAAPLPMARAGDSGAWPGGQSQTEAQVLSRGQGEAVESRPPRLAHPFPQAQVRLRSL